MKAAKLYALTWIIVAAVILSAEMTNSLGPFKLILFGFLGSTLFFMGLAAAISHLISTHHKPISLIELIKTNRSNLPTEDE